LTVWSLVQRMGPGHWSHGGKLAAALGLAFLVHLPSLGLWVAINVVDAQAYAMRKPCVDGLASIPEGQKAIVIGEPFDAIWLHGILFAALPESSSTRAAYESLFDFRGDSTTDAAPDPDGRPLVMLREKNAPICRIEWRD
jgi:hypothetical protein